MKSKEQRIRPGIIVMLWVMILALVPALKGYDNTYWGDWSGYILAHGLSDAYGSGTNYLPLYQYVMWAFGQLAGSADNIHTYIGYLRAFTLIADFWGLWMVYKWVNGKVDYVLILCFSMLNIAYAYNTVIWGQVDGILAALLFAAFYFQYRDKVWLSGLMLLLALNMKLQAIVFVPVWGLLLLEWFMRSRDRRGLFLMLAVMIAGQAVILIPFSLGPGGVMKVWQVTTGLVGSSPIVSVGAYNMWYWIVPEVAERTLDTTRSIAGLTYNQLGFITFCIASCFALLPLLRVIFKHFAGKELSFAPPDRQMIWLTAALIALLFFFCNTQMHERYAHPAFIFLTAYAFHTRRFGIYAVFSIACLLNMEAIMHWFNLRKYSTLIFDPGFVAALFAACIIWMAAVLYRRAIFGKAQKIPPGNLA